MVVYSFAAPPTPWAMDLAQPQIHETAYIHESSNVIGDVFIGADVLVAPGTSIRADEGSPFHIGAGSNIQDGVVIHGLEQGRITGDDGREYSVWVGDRSSITHKALVHGPCYIGEDCFIGFRSTVFNARVGDGCIVMMHVLIQDVEIPPGKYVPSGSIITNQQQADRLPDAQPQDTQFAHHVIGINEALRTGYRCAADQACILPIRQELENVYQASGGTTSSSDSSKLEENMSLNSEVVQNVRQLLAGGYKIGTEHVDVRRFRINSWDSCSPIESKHESEVLSALAACLNEHKGEYVRLIGIDPVARKRVLEMIIHRPGDQLNGFSSQQSAVSGQQSAVSSQRSAVSAQSGDLHGQVQSILSQGLRLTTEYADVRRYKSGAWQSGPSIQAGNAGQAIAALQTIMQEHSGEYVRLVGADPTAKRRVTEVIVQYPDGKAPQGSTSNGSSASRSAVSSQQSAVGAQSGDLHGQVQSILSQGLRLTTEYADVRRYKSGAWQSGPSIQAGNAGQAIAALQTIMQEHSGEYVRLVGADPTAKRRVTEVIVQYPDGKAPQGSQQNGSSGQRSAVSGQQSAAQSYGAAASHRLGSEVEQQVSRIIAQGGQLRTEYADKRRYKSGAWNSGPSIQAGNAAQAIAALEAIVAEHSGEYVRLVGVDPNAKRRIAEVVVQKA